MGRKILIIANDSGGLYRFRALLISELMNKGYEVVACVPFGVSIYELQKMGVQLINISISRRGVNPIADTILFLRYAYIVRMIKPDFTITYTIKPNVYGGLAARIARIPYAINITGLGTAFQKEGILKKMVTAMYKLSCKKARVVFFENAENQQIFLDAKIVQKEQICLLNGAGVNLEHYAIADYPGGEVTKFLFIGRVMKEKGIDEILAAMKKLVDVGVSCRLDVVGGYEEDYIETIERCESEGWLHYWGIQSDVRPFIVACHCFVLPSWHEGMANTNLECAACGRPVITSNIHGCMEAVENGVTGFLCEKENAEDLYNVMKKFMALSIEKRKAMGLAGRKRMEDMFDKKKVVEETIKALKT